MTMRRRGTSAAVMLAALASTACGVAPDLLGSREPCWNDQPRVASLMRGTLTLGPLGPSLATPERGDMPLLAGTIGMEWSGGLVQLVDAEGVALASTGDLITLFGGIGADGMIVCAVESRER